MPQLAVEENGQSRNLELRELSVEVELEGTLVETVHEGTVLMAKRQSPYDYIVTVKHGSFTTAYFYLIQTYVKPGDVVKRGQALGQLRTSVEAADFHFEIWNNQDRVNPDLWLQKR